MKRSFQISSRYSRPVIEAAVMSAILLVLSAMILDMGEMLYASVYAIAGFWAGVLLIVLRRPQSPTNADLRVIRFGTPVAFFVSPLLSPWIWKLRGLQP